MSLSLGYLAHPEGNKCYLVRDDDRGSILVWARFHAEARRHGAGWLDSDWESVECERYPQLDHFEGDLLTWCLEHGWTFGCTECEAICYYQENLVIERGDIFCSKEHAEKFHVRWDARRALEKRFEEAAQKKFPEQKVTRASVNVEGDGIIYFSHETGGGCRILDKSELRPL